MHCIARNLLPFVEREVDAGSVRAEEEEGGYRRRAMHEQRTAAERVARKVDSLVRRLVVDERVGSLDVPDRSEEVRRAFALDEVEQLASIVLVR
mgnify:FL=1